MKILLVGGAHQGKRAYAEATFGLCALDFAPGGRAVDHFHLVVREHMERGRDPADLLPEPAANVDWIILCDEVGGGVIPLDAFDRRWRESVGRLCCRLAAQADIVERISCGIPLRLKGPVPHA